MLYQLNYWDTWHNSATNPSLFLSSFPRLSDWKHVCIHYLLRASQLHGDFNWQFYTLIIGLTSFEQIIIIREFFPRAGPSLQVQERRLQFCWRRVFDCKLRNQGYIFTRDWIGVVTSQCFPHPILSLASKQTLKYPRDTDVEVRKLDLTNWSLWTSLKFSMGVKCQFHQGFWSDQRSGNPNHPSLPFNR